MKKKLVNNDESSSADDPESERPGWSRVRMVALISGVAIASVVGGVAITMMLGDSSTTAEETSESEDAAPIDIVRTLATADGLMASGRAREAMELYQLAEGRSKPVTPLDARTPGTPTSGFDSTSKTTYRMGLCAEQVGDTKAAIEKFEAVARDRSSGMWLPGVFGLARVKFRQAEFSEVVDLLSPIVLTSGRKGASRAAVGADIDYLLGLAIAAEVRQHGSHTSFDLEHVFGPNIDFTLEDLADLQMDADVQTGELTDLGSRFGIKIHGASGEGPSSTLLSAGFDQQTVAELLDLLAQATSWKMQLSESASEIALVKRTDVHITDRTASELLSLVLRPLGLSWQFADGTITIDRLGNFPDETVQADKLKRAEDLLQFALIESPDHRFATRALIELANLAHKAGRTDRAMTFLQEVKSRFNDEAMAQIATFNRAKIFLGDNDQENALKTFYEVIDEHRGSPLEGLAYLYAGRTHLIRNEVESAKQSLSRSLAVATEPQVRGTAALTLASAYLLSDGVASAVAANEVLMEARDDLSQEPWRQQAVFLSSLTRFRAAHSVSERQRLGEELMADAAQVNPAFFFGYQGYLLVGNAFRELNFTRETVKTFKLGLGAPVGDAMHGKLLYQLAKLHRDQNELEAAKRALLELSNTSDTWAAKALIELASLLVQKEQFGECLQYCRWALENKAPSQAETVLLLRTMGNVYEELGDHRNAGLCFNGFLPPKQLTETVR